MPFSDQVKRIISVMPHQVFLTRNKKKSLDAHPTMTLNSRQDHTMLVRSHGYYAKPLWNTVKTKTPKARLNAVAVVLDHHSHIALKKETFRLGRKVYHNPRKSTAECKPKKTEP